LLSDSYGAAEDEVGRTSERDIVEAVIVLFEADFHDIATSDKDADGGWFSGFKVVDKGRRDDAGAAGEGFAFDAAFVGADDEVLFGGL